MSSPCINVPSTHTAVGPDQCQVDPECHDLCRQPAQTAQSTDIQAETVEENVDHPSTGTPLRWSRRHVVTIEHSTRTPRPVAVRGGSSEPRQVHHEAGHPNLLR